MAVSPLKAIAEPRRQRILRLVWDRERSAGEIAGDADVTFGAISQHLRVLEDAGLIQGRREGRHRFYRARRDALGPFTALLESMWSDRLGALKTLAEREERETKARRDSRSPRRKR